MKRLNKVLIPLVALVLAFAMIFSVACNNGGNPEKNTYTVTYTVNGEIYAKQTYEEGQALSAPADPVVTGFNFVGWNTLEDGTGDALVEGSAVTANAAYYAVLQSTSSDNPGGNGEVDNQTTYKIIFDLNNGSGIYTEYPSINVNTTIEAPKPPQWNGHQFTGWYNEAECRTKFDFSTKITSSFTLYAGWNTLDSKILDIGSYNESAYAVWTEGTSDSAVVRYRVQGSENTWHTVPEELIRQMNEGEARVDLLGLNPEKIYEIEIVTSSGDAINVSDISVSAYDRSGYAHFNYTKGIGAYQNNGELKNGALVIFVDQNNVNDVTDHVYKYTNGEYEKQDITQYITTSQNYVESTSGVTGGVQKGIGQILNNRRYSGSDRYEVGIAKLSRVYGAVAVRFIGKVANACNFNTGKSSIVGLTDYDSTLNGGTEGDQGTMARMVNAQHVTIEGVGADAMIYGWGFHYVSSTETNKPADAGTSFEVRNITFDHYQEDAVGMEGEQSEKKSTATLTASVERLWIHNNTFYPGGVPEGSAAESDKGEGDGSCDFKRGQYYTLSYNYFENCHKTNLIGNSGYAIQFNVTMHHNWWNNCASRQPLARHANIHFYNNYVTGTTDSVSSMRAASYMFAEANYYYTCSRVVEYKSEDGSTGTVKSFNDVFLNNYRDNSSSKVETRDQIVDNNCEYKAKGINYSHFDTDPTLFYYDAENKVSDCLLDDALTARVKVIMNAGANGHGSTDTAINDYTPTASVALNDEGDTVITLPASKSDTTVNGVMFTNISGASSGTIKFKGQGITFKLNVPAEITYEGTAKDAEHYPELVSETGAVIAAKADFTGKVTKELEPGIYFITSGIGLIAGSNAKECTITSLKFSAAAGASERRLEAAVTAISAIPSNTDNITLADSATVAAAKNAYNDLKADEKQTFNSTHPDLVARLTAAEAKINGLLIENVEALIAKIADTVTANSLNDIKAARAAYDALSATLQSQVKNRQKLFDAEAAFADIAVDAVITSIDNFRAKAANPDSLSREELEALLDEADLIKDAYNDLTDGTDETENQQAQVTNYTTLLETIQKINQAMAYYAYLDVQDYFVEGDTISVAKGDGAKIAELTDAYSALTSAQQARVKDIYDEIMAKWQSAKPEIVTCYFTRANGNSGDAVVNESETGTFVFGSDSAKKSGTNEVHTLNTQSGSVSVEHGLKLESSTVLTINLSGNATVYFYVCTEKNKGVAVNGTGYTATNGVITVSNVSGTLKVTRNGGEDHILFIEIIYN